MNFVKIAVVGSINALAARRFGDGSVRAQRRRKFTDVSELPVAGDAKEVAVVFELPASGDLVQVLRRPGSLPIRPVGCVTRSDGRGGTTLRQ